MSFVITLLFPVKGKPSLTGYWQCFPATNSSAPPPYIEANQNFIPNYGDRCRHGEKISTAFAESAVNQVVSKRMVKKQQMQWTESGAHNLLQIRTKVLNNQLRETFVRWYPGMQNEQETEIQKKVA